MLHVTRQLLSCIACIGMVIILFGIGKCHVFGEFTGKARGFGGEITARALIQDGRIVFIDAEGPDEAAAIGGAALPVMAERMLEKQSLEVDAVSGATYTSMGMINAVREALAQAGVSFPQADKREEVTESAFLQEPLEFTADIAVAGGGGAGMIAAIHAAEAGKRVIILEKNAVLGGNTARAGMGVAAAGTHYQEEQGIRDSVSLFEKDITAAAGASGDPLLSQALAKDSGALIDWLDSRGILLSGDMEETSGHSVPRLHTPAEEEGRPMPVGSVLAAGLMENVRKLGISVMTGTTVTGVLMEDGRTSGLRALSGDGREVLVRADAVIIATGGFSADPGRISFYRPDLKRISPVGVRGNDGAAVDYLQALRVDFVDMNSFSLYPAFAPDGTLAGEELLFGGGILVNQAGNRFLEGTEDMDAMSGAILHQEGGRAILLADQALFEASPGLQDLHQRGLVYSARRPAELAKNLGFTGNAVGNLENVLAELEDGPYYAFFVNPGVMVCLGGIRIDEEARVLNMDGTPIPGLYAAGEVTGGVQGGACLPGDSLTDAGVFGLRAAESAVKLLGEKGE